MKRIEERPSRFLLILYRILMAAALVLLLLILGGTLYALVFRAPSPAAPPSAPPLPGGSGASAPGAESRIFTGLGRLRASTAGPGAGTLILSVTFPYYPGDRPFSEELASQVRQLRDITTGYFASLSLDELRRRDEGLIKGELLDRYNAVLRLGRIEVLYFNDYMILE
jgi:flagellar basal body-associated protein FliL